MIIAISIVVAICLALSLFIETSSWWVRGLSSDGRIGTYISRSNIYLYGGRFFALFFNALLAFQIESGAHPKFISLLLGASFLVASLVQCVGLNRSRLTVNILALLARALLLPRGGVANFTTIAVHRDMKLVLATAWSAFVFGLGLAGPLLLASIIPEYRLLISNVGQVINAAGMIIILLFVDQRLFRALDDGDLHEKVIHYTHGRIAGFAVVGLCFLAIGEFGL